MDCVVSGRSGKGGLLVMVDRHSRYTLPRRLPSFSQKAVLHALRTMVREGAMMLRGAKEKEESKKRKGNSSQYFSNGSISSLSSLSAYIDGSPAVSAEKFPKGSGLDLADTRVGDPKHPAHLLAGVVDTVSEAKTSFQKQTFILREQQVKILLETFYVADAAL